MKLVPLVAALLASMYLALPAGASAPEARLTIPSLGIVNKPIGLGDYMLRYGPIWEPSVKARPGQGKPMVIAGHDVTYVPGYGSHGPFYNLSSLRKGYLIEIRWHSVLRKYRIVSDPLYHPESDYKVVVDRGVESIWLYSCWPRYTHYGRKWVEADLVATSRL